MGSKVVIYHCSCRFGPWWQSLFASMQTGQFFCCGGSSSCEAADETELTWQSQRAEPAAWGDPHLSPAGCSIPDALCWLSASQQTAFLFSVLSLCPPASNCVSCGDKAVVTWTLCNSGVSAYSSSPLFPPRCQVALEMVGLPRAAHFPCWQNGAGPACSAPWYSGGKDAQPGGISWTSQLFKRAVSSRVEGSAWPGEAEERFPARAVPSLSSCSVTDQQEVCKNEQGCRALTVFNRNNTELTGHIGSISP